MTAQWWKLSLYLIQSSSAKRAKSLKETVQDVCLCTIYHNNARTLQSLIYVPCHSWVILMFMNNNENGHHLNSNIIFSKMFLVNLKKLHLKIHNFWKAYWLHGLNPRCRSPFILYNIVWWFVGCKWSNATSWRIDTDRFFLFRPTHNRIKVKLCLRVIRYADLLSLSNVHALSMSVLLELLLVSWVTPQHWTNTAYSYISNERVFFS